MFLSKLVARTNGTASCEEQSDALSNDMESFVEKCDLQFDDSKQFSLTKFISRARCWTPIIDLSDSLPYDLRLKRQPKCVIIDITR